MNRIVQKLSHSDSGTAEATLQLIATLPAPAGLEGRVRAGLHSMAGAGRVLAWPGSGPENRRSGTGWMRSAAAAAIVFVIAGGGWGVYSHVQQPQAAKVIVLPRGPQHGEFTNAGAMRTPQTINGPVVKNAVKNPATAQPIGAKILPIGGGRVNSNVEPAAQTEK
jgi:hypothetical protein